MTENPQFGPKEIRAEDLAEQTQRIREMASDILGRVQKDFSADLVGGLLFGSPAKIETAPDGKQYQRPWTMGDIMQRMDEMRDEEEKDVRESMTVDIMMAMKIQTDFFDANEHPLKSKSLDIAEFTITLLKNVLDSDENIADPYSVTVGEAYSQAELLEAVRRTVLKPTQILLEGRGRSGIHSVSGYRDHEFWEERRNLITEEMSETDDLEEYNRLERERIKKGLENRAEEEWSYLIGQEEHFLLNYLRQSLRRKTMQLQEEISFAEVFTRGGERVFPDAYIELERRKLNALQEVSKEFGDIGSFTDVRPWIKSRLGEDATFQTFLDFLNPKEQKKEEV